eukprot:TRINITY_DN1770_c0_g1_i1.p1 TRINITY_DN1770_c0_g1~~TRINITY_DN1770_c0_g1_i1.p1  ORF type:complete len:298 (+),score=42.32 TRINITY_DN1770_c0_g1_i1:126-1019(+)
MMKALRTLGRVEKSLQLPFSLKAFARPRHLSIEINKVNSLHISAPLAAATTTINFGIKSFKLPRSFNTERKTANDFLYNSVCEADVEGIRKAIQNGADVNGFFIFNDERTAVLHWAAREASRTGNLDLVRWLVDHRANLELRVEDGWTPLSEACDEGGLETVKFLIARGANVDVKSGDGEYPLHMAVNRSNEDMVKLLISAKAFIDCKDNEGKTPLALAAEDGKQDIVMQLLDANANSSVTDNNNLTPAQLADTEGHHRVARLIRRHAIKGRVRKLQQDLTELQQVLKEDEESETRF